MGLQIQNNLTNAGWKKEWKGIAPPYECTGCKQMVKGYWTYCPDCQTERP